MKRMTFFICVLFCVVAVSAAASAQGRGVTIHGQSKGNSTACSNLPGYATLKAALDEAVAEEETGLNLHMWATVVDRNGVVCSVAFSGLDRGAQWPGGRVISAKKANTANAFSLDFSSGIHGSGAQNGLALSTANLYSAVQPGGSLFGLQESNPVAVNVAYQGPSDNYGRSNDPMVGKKIGGVNVFGGGLGLYAPGSQIIGGIGVSGDTSCADHRVAWRIRNHLSLDMLSGVDGVSGDPERPDNIVFDITPNPEGGAGISAGGFGHPRCTDNDGEPMDLPAVRGDT